MKITVLFIFILNCSFSFSQVKFINDNGKILKTCCVSSDCSMTERGYFGSKTIETINKGDSVKVIGQISAFYKVIYREKTGYININYIKDESLEKIILNLESSQLKTINENKLIDLRKKYSEFDAQCIIDMRLRIGMSKPAAFEIWGNPTNVNRTILENSIEEQCVYDEGNFKLKYLYFTNNKLTAIQD